MKAICYCRVSSAFQAKEDRDGFKRQMVCIESYAKKKRIEIVDVFQDAISGTKGFGERPAMAAMLDRIDSNGVRTVLIERADRLARDAMQSEIIYQEFTKRGIKIILCENGTEYTGDETPTGKLIRTVLAAVSEFDKNCISHKLKAARDRKKKNGQKCEGKKAYGEIDSKEKEVKELMVKLRRKPRKGKRLSYQGIADELNGRGIHTRSGKPWLSNGVRQVLVA